MDFAYQVSIPVAKTSKITYSVKLGATEDTWIKRVKPPEGCAVFLRSIGCKKDRDYVYTADQATHSIVYHFRDNQDAVVFALAMRKILNTSVSQPTIHTCPNCGTQFA